MKSISQEYAQELIEIDKHFVERILTFPEHSKQMREEVLSGNERFIFIIIVNRKVSLEIRKCTNLIKNENEGVVLARIDLGKRLEHRNPDYRIIKGPHIHTYKEGFDDKFAYPLEEFFADEISSINQNNMIEVFKMFCKYCRIEEGYKIQQPLEVLL